MVSGIAILLGSVCIPVGAMFFKINRREDSQAGRRRFESGLPLHLFNHLRHLADQRLSHLSQLGTTVTDVSVLKSAQSADTAARFRAMEEST